VRAKRDKGVALITVMLVLILVSAIVVGMSWMVMTDQRLGGNNQDRQKAFYGAEAAMEKLTADTGTVFTTKGALTAADVTALVATPPPIFGIQYKDASGASTYQILCGVPAVSPCNPAPVNAAILPPSAYAGMQALITGLQLTVAAQTSSGSEVKLNRQIQVVAIPVFQFGIYSDTDLSFFNGPPFDFGGRVHTNGNLWITSNRGPLYLADKITVVGQVLRGNLENGQPPAGTIQPGDQYDGPVTIALTPNPAVLPAAPTYTDANWRAIALTEGSMLNHNSFGNLSGVPNNTPPAPGTWTSTVQAYGGMLQNGVKPLTLTTTALGTVASPISLIQRPPMNVAPTNPQQYFLQASLRILLDDYVGGACATADMTKLSGITPAVPVDLAGLGTIAQSGAVQGGAAYNAANGYWISNPAAPTARRPTITGCIKIEYQNAGGAFTDVTAAILGLGIRGENMYPNAVGPFGTNLLLLPTPVLNNTQYSNYFSPNVAANQCLEPDAGAVIRIEHVRDNPSTAALANKYCGAAPFLQTDYWPNVLFDAREATSRPQDANNWPTNAGAPLLITAAGVMNYIELDATNLANWLRINQAGAANVNNTTGFTVYFSDRRSERFDPNAANTRTGSYGYNDFVNGNTDAANGCPNGVIDLTGEDIEGDGILRVYGGAETLPPNLFPNFGTAYGLQLNPNFCNAAGENAKPEAAYVNLQEARENPPVFFRRALKIVNGATLNLGTSCYGLPPNPPCGLTIASENPVYLQGDYNAPGGVLNAPGTVAAAIAADAVTLLSNNWNDVNSFIYPWDDGGRPGAPTAYRVAIIAGKGIPFTQPAGQGVDYGTDGGVHNFLRFLENWAPPTNKGYPAAAAVATGQQTLFYEGSMVSFYFNHQAVGLYKGSAATYSPPNRQYSFDTNFTLGPQWLPPRTPTLRSINTTGFTQLLMPTQ
jgi:hypothetical protein